MGVVAVHGTLTPDATTVWLYRASPGTSRRHINRGAPLERSQQASPETPQAAGPGSAQPAAVTGHGRSNEKPRGARGLLKSPVRAVRPWNLQCSQYERTTWLQRRLERSRRLGEKDPSGDQSESSIVRRLSIHAGGGVSALALSSSEPGARAGRLIWSIRSFRSIRLSLCVPRAFGSTSERANIGGKRTNININKDESKN